MDRFLSPQNDKVQKKAGYRPTKVKKFSTVVFSFFVGGSGSNRCVFCDGIFGTMNILYMLFFMCVFLWLLPYRCGGRATIFKFKQNSFHVHAFNVRYIVLPLSPFFVHCCQICFL